MAGITTFLDESQMPNRTQEQKVFDNLLAYVFQNFPKWGREVNDTLGALNALQAGGTYALPYIFDTATGDADPGVGKLRLSSATQSAATVMRLDLTAGGQDYTTLLDTMDSSTSVIKGSIRLVKQGDLNKWMTFDVTARAAPAGYRNIAVVCTDSSSTSPFGKDDPLLLFFQRNGDKGELGQTGMPVLAAVVISSPVANIDFLNIFNSNYDKYTVELQGLTQSASNMMAINLAFAGSVDFTANYAGGFTNTTTSNGAFAISNASSFTGTIEIRDVNRSSPKGISLRGFDGAARFSEGSKPAAAAASGFRISAASSFFTAGIIRIYGNRNN